MGNGILLAAILVFFGSISSKAQNDVSFSENNVCRIYLPANAVPGSPRTFLTQIYGSTVEHARYEMRRKGTLRIFGFEDLRRNGRGSQKGLYDAQIKQLAKNEFQLTYEAASLTVTVVGPFCPKLLNAWDGSLLALSNLTAMNIWGRLAEEE